MGRSLTGKVVSDKPDKTIVVSVASTKMHPVYRKRYVINTKFMAHDEKNEAHQGDLVVITETRPLSAKKRFTLDKIVETAAIEHIEPEVKVEKPAKNTDEDKKTVAKVAEPSTKEDKA